MPSARPILTTEITTKFSVEGRKGISRRHAPGLRGRARSSPGTRIAGTGPILERTRRAPGVLDGRQPTRIIPTALESRLSSPAHRQVREGTLEWIFVDTRMARGNIAPDRLRACDEWPHRWGAGCRREEGTYSRGTGHVRVPLSNELPIYPRLRLSVARLPIASEFSEECVLCCWNPQERAVGDNDHPRFASGEHHVHSVLRLQESWRLGAGNREQHILSFVTLMVKSKRTLARPLRTMQTDLGNCLR
jgi:hypothetical protein